MQTPRPSEAAAEQGSAEVPLLSVVVPVFNQAASIVRNLRTIRERVADGLPGSFEIVVVSDGSIDATEDELLDEQGDGGFRVIHYDRNLGKGYAVKIGALEANGEWVGFIDADLDLDPADLAVYVRRARDRQLDFAIGSKRHPGSHVQYPRSRVVASWFFQQLVRLLFRLDVRDTQVGLKVFRREVADQVLPFLMIKRFAFDIELLAVARAFGFDRIEEMPVRLDYRFTGSGVRSRAVLRALVDTIAIFYRLRVLRYYQRRRALAGVYGWTRPRAFRPLVSVIVAAGARFREPDYPDVEVIESASETMAELRDAARMARGEILAVLEPDAQAAANWLAATVPFFAREDIAAVVVPRLAPLHGPVKQQAAAAIAESRLGAGRGYFRYTPGNVRYVRSFPASSLVIRKRSLEELPESERLEGAVSWLASHGSLVLYTPETVVVSEPKSLFMPYLRAAFRQELAHAELAFLALVAAVALIVAAALFGAWPELSAAAVAYAGSVLLVAAAAGIRRHSLAVGGLVAAGTVAVHAVYIGRAVRGVVAK